MKSHRFFPGRSSILFKLRGGIGNQLFIYTAAKHYENMANIDLIFDESGIDHGESILRFLPGETSVNSRTLGEKFLRKLFVLIHVQRGGTLNLESQVNYENLNLDLAGYSAVQGFFQTSRYFQALSLHQQDLIRGVFTPSEWAKGVLPLLEAENSILVHVRAGDYLNHKNSLGLLSPDYYSNCIKRVPTKEPARIFVVTDDANYALNLLSNLRDSVTILKGPAHSSVSDSIFLIANAKKVVIANSSFSYWGALLNRNKSLIYYPYPWFKGEKYAMDAFPEIWIPVESSWK